MARLRVATCQFPVGADVSANAARVIRQIRLAGRRGARVAHFCEGALSGYAGTDFDRFDGFDWERLAAAHEEVADEARRLGVWVVLGSSHPLTPPNRPHNSLYVIDDQGRLVERYDKRFCSKRDLVHYSPGDHFSVFSIDGVSCGALICYDYRFPELYRGYKGLGVKLVFHSFHAGHLPPDRLAEMGAAIGPEFLRSNPAATHTYPGITMPAAMTTAAACNHVWISCPNSSAPESAWPAFFVRADGITTGRLRRNVAGVLVSEVDTDQALYDSTEAWRDRAMSGVLHSGTLVTDPRSARRDRF
ncbi:MAG TPA: carbon-nitrogen hydrolase family protein [Acidimicrobiales bacterium]|nr:carbon-nitrogen hydrolase family protein [Acidimicrobiales bacterium]